MEVDEEAAIEAARQRRKAMVAELAVKASFAETQSSVSEKPASEPGPASLPPRSLAAVQAQHSLPSSTWIPSPDQVPSPVTAVGLMGGTGPNHDDDGDMFGEAFDFEAAANERVTFGHRDNFDDSEGYYRIRQGETIGPEQRYTVFATTGQGTFSNVVRARDGLDRDCVVAIKIIRNPPKSNEMMIKAAMKELEICRKINSYDKEGKHHCVQFKRHFMHKDHLCLVFENCSMNLREVIKKFGRVDGEVVGLNLAAVSRYAQQLLLALKLCKRCRIVHADFKPDNILVTASNTQVKLCDFGSASDISERAEADSHKGQLVSRFYRAPEIMVGQDYDYGIDMWALACTLFELYTGRILFQGRSNNGMLKEIFDLKGKPSKQWIGKGIFKHEHFDEASTFVYMDEDKNTGNVVPRMINYTAPVRDLKSILLGVSKPKNEAEKRKVLQLKDLLERMLVVDSEKRITPKEALSHPFLTA